MALFVRQDENRTELQKRVASELQDRARKKAEEAELPDGVDDSAYIKGTEQSNGLLWLWLTIAGLAVVAIIILIIKAGA